MKSFLPSRRGVSLRARLMAPVNDVLHLLAAFPRLVQLGVAMLFIVGSQSAAFADGSFASSGMQGSMSVIGFVIMCFAYIMALVLIVSGGFAWKRGDEYWLHLIGAVVMAMAPSLASYIFGANGLTNAALTSTQINDAMNK